MWKVMIVLVLCAGTYYMGNRVGYNNGLHTYGAMYAHSRAGK